MKKYLSFLAILFIILSADLYSDFDGTIQIDFYHPTPHIVKREFYGGFCEFLLDYINGPMGIWSQEFNDRGFDIADYYKERSFYWNLYRQSWDIGQFSLPTVGYNKNGKYAQRIEKKETENLGLVGVYQQVILNDSVDHNFYIYFRGKLSDKTLQINIYDTTLTTKLYSKQITVTDTNWKKEEFVIKNIANYPSVNVFIGFMGTGWVEFDEVSLMPANNVNGVRKEYYDLFKNWNMGLLRYPGGCFADFKDTKLVNAIGDIDQRKSPVFGDASLSQRMDFGVDEYFKLINALGIRPYITVNFMNGTPEEAAQWVEYCNYDTLNSNLAKQRAKNGSVKPYNVEWFEIGNEQWYYPEKYAKDYYKYYKELKETDSTIKIITATDVWPGQNYFNLTMDSIRTNANVYGYHPILFTRPEEPCTDEEIYLSHICLPQHFEYIVRDLESWLIKGEYFPTVRQGATEWAMGYESFPDIMYDKNFRGFTLENGLAYAGQAFSFMKNAKSFEMSNVTLGFNFIARKISKIDGRKKIFGLPTYYAFSMLSNHLGDTLQNTKIISPYFYTREVKGLWNISYDLQWIDAVSTVSKDSIFVYVVNRHPADNANINLQFLDIPSSTSMKVYQLKSKHYLDNNSAENPYKVVPTEFETALGEKFSFPPHSLTILSLPKIFDASSVDTLKIDSILTLSPNPVDNYLNINTSLRAIKNVNISIYNMLGEKVYENHLDELSYYFEVNTSNFHKGAYFVVVNSPTYNQVLNFIKI